MEPESEWLLQERIRALEAANDEALRQNQQDLATELEAVTRIQRVATQLISTRGTAELYEQILDSVKTILHADFASIQMFYPERGTHGELRLLGYRGFSQEAAKRWEWVRLSTRTTCGEALRTGQRVIVTDVRACDFMAGSDEVEAYLSAGIRAVQTTPLVSRSGALVGMVSTHWREPREPAASELRALDVLARMAADLIERSRVEEALAENQQHLASIYNTVRDVIFHLAIESEAQFRFISVNEAFLRVTGLSREMVVGKSVNEVIPEPSLTMVLGKYRQAIEERTTVLWEETSDYPTGQLTGEVSVTPVIDDKGTCTHLVGSVHDITDRKRAEVAQRESEVRLAEHVAELNRVTHLLRPVACFVRDLEDRIVYWNPGAADLYGYSKDEVLGQISHALLKTQFPEPLADIVRQIQTVGSWDGELLHTHHDGHRLSVASHWALHKDFEGRPTSILEVNLDITDRKEAERRFHSLMEAAPDAIVVIDREGKIFLTNMQAEKLFGYERHELYGKSAEILMPERFRANHSALRRNFFQEPKAREMGVGLELYGLHKDGREFPVEVSLSPLETEKGILVTSAIRDVTERKRTETELRDSEERLALAQDAAQIGVWDSDLKTNVITVCGHFARLHGFSPDRTTITRQEWSSLIHPDDRERVDTLRREARERTHTFDAEFRVIWPEGSTHWVHAKGTVLIDGFGQPSRTTGVVWDITERKQAEAKLSESEERFRRVFEEGPIGLALVARDRRFLRVNNALCQMLGYPEGELLQKTFADITHPDDLRADVELVERLFRGEIPFYRMQKRYVKKTGDFIWINLTASLLRDRESNSLQRLTMIEDITEIKRNQEAAILSQRLESVGTLAGGIAHDFNNLLGAVLAQVELAQAELAEGSSPEVELKTIRDAAMRGSEIVRELMIYAGKESKDLELVDVSEVVEQMLELLKVSVSKHATFKIYLDHNLPSIRATAAQISQLVMNLTTNASEALGDRDGVIRITTRRVMVGHGSKEMQGMAKGEHVQVEVSDTGCGIPPEMQARIFDPFFSTKPGGRGLGLAMVHGIVKDLGGAINLLSEPGNGTTFRISLPCADVPSDSIRGVISEIGQPAPPSQPAAVLVVEDEDPLRQAVSMMLRKRGFSVVEARDGSAALDAIRAQDNLIHVLFLDITLPGAPAKDVLQEARRLRPEMRVVITTAYSKETAGALLQSTIEHFIRKPYRVNDLVRLIDLSMS